METKLNPLRSPQAEAELEGFRVLALKAEAAAVEVLRTAAQSGIVDEPTQLAEARARLDALVEISRNRAEESAEKRTATEQEAEAVMQHRARELAALDEAQARTARLNEEKAAHQAEAVDMRRRIQDQQAEVNSLVDKRNKAIADRRYAEKWCWIPFYGLYLAIDNSVQDYDKKARDAEALQRERERDLRKIEDRFDCCAKVLCDAERELEQAARCRQAIQDDVNRLQETITGHKQVFALWDNLCLYYLSLITRFEAKLLDRKGLQQEIQETGTILLTI